MEATYFAKLLMRHEYPVGVLGILMTYFGFSRVQQSRRPMSPRAILGQTNLTMVGAAARRLLAAAGVGLWSPTLQRTSWSFGECILLKFELQNGF